MSQGMNIGIAGLGKMGQALAGRLSNSGFTVRGWTRSGVSSVDAKALGISAVADLGELADTCDILLLSLFDDDAVISVLNLLCRHDLTNVLIVDTSTVSPNTLPGQLDRVKAAGGTAIDAPISGWPAMVSKGIAGLYIGGSSQDVARFKPVAEAISNRVHHVGDLGQGAAAKIVNNMMLASYWQCLKEALQVGQSAGLAPEKMVEILTGSPAANGSLAAKAPVILGESETVSFTVSAMVKDTSLFNHVAMEAGIDVPALNAALASYQTHSKAGFGAADFVTMVHSAITNTK